MATDNIIEDLSLFIAAISSSNLETLHSKAIAWLLNLPNTPVDSKCFFFKTIINREKDSDFEHVFTIAEVANHDLITLLIIENKFRLIIWENKIKADFHQKKISQLPLKKKPKKSNDKLVPIYKILETYENTWLRGISQPFWYQIRWLLWRLIDENEIKEKIICPIINELEKFNRPKFDRLEKMINSKSGQNGRKMKKEEMVNYIDENTEVDWVVLSPHKEEHIKIFHNSQWNGNKSIDSNIESGQIKGDSELLKKIIDISENISIPEWKYTTYDELLKKDLHQKSDNAVAKAYLQYLSGNKDFKNVSLNGFGVSTKGQIKIVNDNEDESDTVNDTEGEYNLQYLLEIWYRLNEKNSHLDFEWLTSGSERNGNPLLNIIIGSIKLSKENTNELNKILVIPEKVKESKMNEIGVTLQIQGKVKLQFAHRAYHQVKMNNIQDYKCYVFNLLSQNWNNSFKSKEDRLKFIRNNLVSGVNTEYIFKENSPSSKTGLSYTIENPKQGFMNERNVNEIIEAISRFLNNHFFHS